VRSLLLLLLRLQIYHCVTFSAWRWGFLSHISSSSPAINKLRRLPATSVINSPCSVAAKGLFIATELTQLSSTLNCDGEVSIATPASCRHVHSVNNCHRSVLNVVFNSHWVSCIADRRRQLSCVGEGVYSDATQLNSTSSWVELRRHKRALSVLAALGLEQFTACTWWNPISAYPTRIQRPCWGGGVRVEILRWCLVLKKVDQCGYPMVKKMTIRLFFLTESTDVTDRRTDRQTDRFSISISRVSML